MLKTVPSLFLLISVVCAYGCATTVKSREYPALQERGTAIARIAVAPFQASGRLAQAREAAPGVPRSVATDLVARCFTEALVARGIDVVPTDQVARALTVERADREPLLPRAVASVVARDFGADAVLMGKVSRFVERSGQAAGTLHPAGVGFEVTLYAAPGAQKLWNAIFDEPQKPLSENVLSTYRYPGGGMRWLTAEELARWGAKETVEELPVE
jgi:hypothetical protein